MNWKKLSAAVFGTLALFVGFLCFFAARWYLHNFGGQSVNSILFTLFSGLGGVEKGLMISFLQRPVMLSAVCTGLVTLFFCQSGRFQLKLLAGKRRITLSPVRPWIFSVISLAGCIGLIVSAAYVISLPQWIAGISSQSKIFAEEYVDPETVEITFPEQKRNLVYIYLESMETTFFSREQGGYMDSCVIPELYDLAAQNTNFSTNDQVGGWYSVTGGTWTTAGLVTQVGGIPLLLPFGGASNEKMTRVLPGATLLWDVLAREGYYQAMMLGSDKNFSDQIKLTEQHGINMLYDYNSAMEDGFIPKDYYEWWGMEDEKLFAYARQELTKIAQGDQPFNFTLFTIDTHFPDGFACRLCTSDYAEQYENVYACSSRQVAEFVRWLQEQPFYENTTVILCGDHLTMDKEYISRNGLTDVPRWVYNCILNAPISAENTRNRVFTSLDMYPTTLAALGCTIEGNRLALGTNLYSHQPTLAERIGIGTLNLELTRGTVPYLFKFLLDREYH